MVLEVVLEGPECADLGACRRSGRGVTSWMYHGHGRLMWVEQSDPDGNLILNIPVGSSAVPSSLIDFAPERGGPEIDWLVSVLRLCPPPVAHASSTTTEGLCS